MKNSANKNLQFLMKDECLNERVRINFGNESQPNATQNRSVNQDDKALASLFAGQMQFSLDIFKRVFNDSKPVVQANKGTGENIFFSPTSIYSALLLAYFGASNRTEEQLATVLGFETTDKVNHCSSLSPKTYVLHTDHFCLCVI